MSPAAPRLVILGTGLGAFKLLTGLRDNDHITGVSPRKDFLFTEGPPLPATAQTAQQEGTRLARVLTARARHRPLEPIRHHHLGMSHASRGSVRLQSWRPARAVGCRHGYVRARPL